MKRMLAAAALAALLVAPMAGCAPTPEPAGRATYRPTVPASTASSGSSGSSTSAAALAEARIAAGIPDCPQPAPARPVAGGLPSITLGCLGSDRTVNLADLRGKPMIINVWAQWCPPCRQEYPHLRDVAAQAGDKLLVIGINYNDPQPDWAIEFASLAGWRYPHLVDPGRSITGPLAVRGIPMTLLVDAEGTIVHRIVGQVASTAELSELVQRHLGVTL